MLFSRGLLKYGIALTVCSYLSTPGVVGQETNVRSARYPQNVAEGFNKQVADILQNDSSPENVDAKKSKFCIVSMNGNKPKGQITTSQSKAEHIFDVKMKYLPVILMKEFEASDPDTMKRLYKWCHYRLDNADEYCVAYMYSSVEIAGDIYTSYNEAQTEYEAWEDNDYTVILKREHGRLSSADWVRLNNWCHENL